MSDGESTVILSVITYKYLDLRRVGRTHDECVALLLQTYQDRFEDWQEAVPGICEWANKYF